VKLLQLAIVVFVTSNWYQHVFTPVFVSVTVKFIVTELTEKLERFAGFVIERFGAIVSTLNEWLFD